MLKGREILSLPVVTMNDMVTIGEVKDIIYDSESGLIVGYVLETGGWLKHGRGFLHRDVISQDSESLIISDESVVGNISAIEELKKTLDKKSDIRGLRVECDDGRYIGVIQDLVLDGQTGLITGFEVSDGVIQDLLDGRMTIPKRGIKVGTNKVIATLEGISET